MDVVGLQYFLVVLWRISRWSGVGEAWDWLLLSSSSSKRETTVEIEYMVVDKQRPWRWRAESF